MRRREFLTGVAATAAVLTWPRRARAFGDGTKIDIAELQLGPGSLSRPNAWKGLLHRVVDTTSVDCQGRAVQVDPSSDELFKHPFSVLLGDGAFSMPPDAALEQLSRYLSYGGFLLIDDTTGSATSAFDTSVRRLCDTLFPTRPLAPLPTTHPVYRSFFLLDHAVGRVDRQPYLEGITTIGSYAPILYCRNDLSGALDSSDSGSWLLDCTPGGESQRREAIKLGINLVLYALTSDYKKDQAHVKELIEDGRLGEDDSLRTPE